MAQLLALGCELGQGYLLARPLTPEMAGALAQAEAVAAASGPVPAVARASPAPKAQPAAAEAWVNPPDWPLTVH